MLAYLSSPFYLRQPKPSPSGWAERIHQQANETRMVSHLRWHRRQYCCHQPEMKQYVVDALRAVCTLQDYLYSPASTIFPGPKASSRFEPKRGFALGPTSYALVSKDAQRLGNSVSD